MLRPVTARPVIRQVELRDGSLLRVLGDVDEDRPRPSRARDEERLADGRRDLVGLGDQVIVFRDRQGHAGHVGLLEGVRAEERRGHLPGDADDRRRVEHRRRDPGHEIGRTRPRGRDAHPDSPGGARVTIGHVGRALLVAHEHVAHRRIVEHRVVGRHDRAARVAEHDVHAFLDERLPDRVCALHLTTPCVPGKVTAPSEADDTLAAYFAITPAR